MQKKSTQVVLQSKKLPAAAKNGSAIVSKKKDESSDSSDSDESSDSSDEENVSSVLVTVAFLTGFIGILVYLYVRSVFHFLAKKTIVLRQLFH